MNLDYKLDDSLLWDDIDKEIKQNDIIVENDDGVYMNINNVSDFDEINYNICIKNILKCFESKQKIPNEKEQNLIFSFNDRQHCPLTNYSYISIFFGPVDNYDFFKKEFKHIFDVINYKIKIIIYKHNDRIIFDLFQKSRFDV